MAIRSFQALGSRIGRMKRIKLTGMEMLMTCKETFPRQKHLMFFYKYMISSNPFHPLNPIPKNMEPAGSQPDTNPTEAQEPSNFIRRIPPA